MSVLVLKCLFLVTPLLFIYFSKRLIASRPLKLNYHKRKFLAVSSTLSNETNLHLNFRRAALKKYRLKFLLIIHAIPHSFSYVE